MILTAQIILFIIALTFLWFAAINTIIVMRQWNDPNYQRSKTVNAFTAQFVVIAIVTINVVGNDLEMTWFTNILLGALLVINVYAGWIYRKQLGIFSEPMVSKKLAKQVVRRNIDELMQDLIAELEASDLEQKECDRIIQNAELHIDNYKNLRKLNDGSINS